MADPILYRYVHGYGKMNRKRALKILGAETDMDIRNIYKRAMTSLFLKER